MEKKKVKLGIIALDGIARLHLNAIPRLHDVVLVSACDSNRSILEDVANIYNIPERYTDYREMLDKSDIDAVIICAPDYLHKEMTIAALEKGMYVLCEKPMSLEVEECKEMLAADKKAGGKLMIGQICRYTPAFVLAKKLVDRGEIGELFAVESEYAHDYKLSRGIGDWRVDPRREGIIGGGCHAIDLLRWIAGDPTEIKAYSTHKCLTAWPVNDATMAVMKFPNGVMGKVFASIGVKRDYTMRSVFYGTQGTIVCNNTDSWLTVYKEGLTEKDSLFTDFADTKLIEVRLPVSQNSHNTYGEIGDFVNMILSGEKVASTPLSGAATVSVAVAAVESSRTGETVEIKYIKD